MKKVAYFGDDFGYGYYLFINMKLVDCIYYLADNNQFKPGWTNYRITNIIQRKKYWIFGDTIIKIELEK